jgi:uncharacterized membrane protein
MNKKGKVLLASAAAGLVTLAVTAGAAGTARAEETPAAKVKCYGANTCKGTGACGGKGHSCAGKNECAGQGWTMQKKEDCLAMKGGRLTPEPEAATPETH